ncbi:MAG: hypothetical protein U5L06_04315 [Rhodovibrio sp.]|nr:hypothetical protein [Rhodovibrio sp.]
MSSKHLRGDVNYAWPTRRDRGDGPEGRGRDHLPRGRQATRTRSTARTEEYRDARSPTPSSPATRGFIDDVIMPHGTRQRLCALARHAAQQGASQPLASKHSNIPLYKVRSGRRALRRPGAGDATTPH